jgi:hypothetical protein
MSIFQATIDILFGTKKSVDPATLAGSTDDVIVERSHSEDDSVKRGQTAIEAEKAELVAMKQQKIEDSIANTADDVEAEKEPSTTFVLGVHAIQKENYVVRYQSWNKEERQWFPFDPSNLKANLSKDEPEKDEDIGEGNYFLVHQRWRDMTDNIWPEDEDDISARSVIISHWSPVLRSFFR